MSTSNEEMGALADFAVKSARDRYKFELDYSEASISSLDKILEKIYWGFSNYTSEERKSGLVLETANIWGSYLGEYMRKKWGGEWIQKGSTRLVLINNVELSPISLVYQKITGNPDGSILDFINKTQGIMYRIAVNPSQAQTATKKIGSYNKDIGVTQPKKSLKLDKRLLYILLGTGGISMIFLAFVVISLISKSGGLPASLTTPSATSTNTEVLVVIATTTPTPTETPSQTITTLPTYTPKPTNTPSPSPTFSPTPSPTPSPTYTLTPTITETEYIWRSPTPSQTPRRTSPPPRPTHTPTLAPSNTSAPPPTETPSPTLEPSNTPEPSPTSAPPTEPAPSIESCDVNPSTVNPLTNTSLTFTVRFSAPGYSISVNNPPDWPGQAGCDGQDSDGDGVASCEGSSGMLPPGTTINVQIETSIGNCSVSYGSN